MSWKEVGEINYFYSSYINWKLPRYSVLPSKGGCRIWSPIFAYANEVRNVVNAPQGWTGYPLKKDFIKLCLTSYYNDKIPDVSLHVGLVDESKNEISTFQCVWNSQYDGFDGVTSVLERELIRRRDGEVLNGYLRFFCELLPNQEILATDASTQTDVEHGIDKILADFRELLTSNKDWDLTMKVKDREFKVHKAILRSRSPVFDAMLTHDLKEKNERLVEIEDCEPEVFEEFLHFVYSGKINDITSVNMCGLYYAADKYNMPDLKEQCISFLKKSFSVENICEIICLASKHRETDLLKLAIEFFAEKMDEILVTCIWLEFMKNNPVEANELYIKCLKLGFTKTARQ